jgi:hypothetical protein
MQIFEYFFLILLISFLSNSLLDIYYFANLHFESKKNIFSQII